MSWGHPRRRWAGAARLTVIAALAGSCLAACGSSRPRAAPRALTAHLNTPLATSLSTQVGTWAVVPMGNLAQPLNTFWQLFFRPNGSDLWSDQVKATATATNGGLVLAHAGPSLLVGVRPSDLLTFSPLIATADAGRSWSDGLVTTGLAARPDALAGRPGGGAIALVSAHQSTEVLSSAGSLSSWQTLITDRALASSGPGRACRPAAVTAVGYVPGTTVIGTSCTRPGKAGIFALTGGRWQAVGPPTSPPSARTEVLGLVPANGKLAALVAEATPGATNVLVASTSDGRSWHRLRPLRLGTGARLLSFGGLNDGVFALVAKEDGKDEVTIAGLGAGGGWRALPSPPPGTATLAVGTGGGVDALAVKRSVLTVWSLSPGAPHWARAQVSHIAIQFGSSS